MSSSRQPRLHDARHALQAPSAGWRLVVLIPALDEQDSIAEVLEDIPPAHALPGIASVEAIVIDDGSQDETAVRASRAGAAHVARHPGSRGLAAVFNRGTAEALARGADIVVTLDGDGQHDPRAIPWIIAPILAGRADIVLAARPLQQASQGSRVRRLGNRAGSALLRHALGLPVSDVTSGYRAFSRDALTRLHVSSGFTYTLDTLIQAASKRLRVEEVEVPARPRAHGESRMTRSIVRYVTRAAAQAFFTTLHIDPLRKFGRLAGVCALGAVVMTGWFLLAYAHGGLHLPSLLAAVFLALSAGVFVLCGLITDGISANRRLLEDVLHHLKRAEAARGDEAAAALAEAAARARVVAAPALELVAPPRDADPQAAESSVRSAP